MSVGGSFRRMYRAGLTLERCSQLTFFATQPISWDAAAVRLVEDGVLRCTPLPISNLMPFGRWWHARGREHCRRQPGSALSGGYAPDSARAEGSSIVDEPGGCWTPVRENQRREPGGSGGKSSSLTTVCFLPTRADKDRRTGKIHGAFPGMNRALNGWMLACAPASPAQGFHHHHGPRYLNFYFIFLYDGWPCKLRKKHGLVDHN